MYELVLKSLDLGGEKGHGGIFELSDRFCAEALNIYKERVLDIYIGM